MSISSLQMQDQSFEVFNIQLIWDFLIYVRYMTNTEWAWDVTLLAGHLVLLVLQLCELHFE